MIGDKRTRLPAEYQEVEWLASHGSEAIKLPAVSKLSDISLDFQMLSTDPPTLFGFSSATAGTSAEDFYIALNSQRKYYVWYGQKRIVSSITDDMSRSVITLKDGIFRINGVVFAEFEPDAAVAPETYLYGRARVGVVYDLAKMRVYSFIVKEPGGADQIALVPCYRKSDGVAGMYDLAAGLFRVNARSSGAFDVGPAV